MGFEEEHHLVEDVLGAYVLGAVEESERREISDHLQKCNSCRRELERLREALALLPEPPRPSDDLWRRIVAEVRRRRQS